MQQDSPAVSGNKPRTYHAAKYAATNAYADKHARNQTHVATAVYMQLARWTYSDGLASIGVRQLMAATGASRPSVVAALADLRHAGLLLPIGGPGRPGVATRYSILLLDDLAAINPTAAAQVRPIAPDQAAAAAVRAASRAALRDARRARLGLEPADVAEEVLGPAVVVQAQAPAPTANPEPTPPAPVPPLVLEGPIAAADIADVLTGHAEMLARRLAGYRAEVVVSEDLASIGGLAIAVTTETGRRGRVDVCPEVLAEDLVAAVRSLIKRLDADDAAPRRPDSPLPADADPRDRLAAPSPAVVLGLACAAAEADWPGWSIRPGDGLGEIGMASPSGAASTARIALDGDVAGIVRAVGWAVRAAAAVAAAPAPKPVAPVAAPPAVAAPLFPPAPSSAGVEPLPAAVATPGWGAWGHRRALEQAIARHQAAQAATATAEAEAAAPAAVAVDPGPVEAPTIGSSWTPGEVADVAFCEPAAAAA